MPNNFEEQYLLFLVPYDKVSVTYPSNFKTDSRGNLIRDSDGHYIIDSTISTAPINPVLFKNADA